MARRVNYDWAKRQKELKRQKKQAAKRARRMGIDPDAPSGPPNAGPPGTPAPAPLGSGNDA